MPLGIEAMNDRFDALLSPEGYELRPWKVPTTGREGRLAENPYFALAFAPYETWTELSDGVQQSEFEVGSQLRKGSSKSWDVYLLLACQEPLYLPEQFDRLVSIQYDTRRMRKLVSWGVGQSIRKVDQLVRPFRALQRIEVVAKTRDPLAALEAKLAEKAADEDGVLSRAIALFRQGVSLDAI